MVRLASGLREGLVSLSLRQTPVEGEIKYENLGFGRVYGQGMDEKGRSFKSQRKTENERFEL